MKKSYGWMGTILRVDLSTGKISKEPLTEEMAHGLLGGRGINSKIIYDETGPDTDALGPDNRVVIGTGPVTGAFGVGNGRYTVSAKSPLTGILGDGSGGGHFGAEVKLAGYDHIVVQGRSEKPVYLYINDDKVTIRDAQHLWGTSTWEARRAIREELGDRDVKSLCIGQAGENLVKYACVVPDDERVPAGTGMGAVMGSKNLKAIAVRGSQTVRVHDADRYEEIVTKWREDILAQPGTASFKDQGTTRIVRLWNMVHILPVKHGQEYHRPEEEIPGFFADQFLPKYLTRHVACFGCFMPCQAFVYVDDGPYAGEKGMRPEMGPLFLLGSDLGVFDFPFTLKATNLANQYAMSCVELSAAIGMAFACYQDGILTQGDTDGLKLEWGNRKAILELIRKIAYREGFGAILAEGCLNAARTIGRGAERYAYHIKGKSDADRCTSYMPTVLGFATATRGFDHLRSSVFPLGRPDEKHWNYDAEIATMVRDREHTNAACDTLELCKFLTEFELLPDGPGTFPRMTQLLSAITGVEFSEDQLHEACDRVYNIERAYLIRCGMERKDDSPPNYFFDAPLPSGPSKGMALDRDKFGELMDAWYELRGSDKKRGAPKRETLERLNLKYVADELERMGVYE